MDWANYIVVGENIHCTRSIKSGGSLTVSTPLGEGIRFGWQGQDLILPVPPDWGTVSPPYADGKLRHITLAIYHAYAGKGELQQLGLSYLCHVARRQIDAGAGFLDVNVDEYTNDSAERSEVMSWLVGLLGKHFDTPLSIDSSAADTLRAGLSACRKDIAPAMLNSLSLERLNTAELVVEFGCHVIVSAAGQSGVPADVDERMANFSKVVGMLDKRGVGRDHMHLDPLVLPISVDSNNGRTFLEATSQAKKQFPGVKTTGGLSNVSFGMPNRRLLNLVFARLAAQAGGCGGIIDPVSMPVRAIAELDEQSESYQLAKNVLTGEDMFGAEYISAFREGRLA